MTTRLLILLCLASLITACTTVPYRIDIDQGNLIDKKALSQLSIGMSKFEVQNILGTPLLTDIFHANRWDYVQYYREGSTQSVQKSLLSLYFVNDLLSEIKKSQYQTIKTKPLPYNSQQR